MCRGCGARRCDARVQGPRTHARRRGERGPRVLLPEDPAVSDLRSGAPPATVVAGQAHQWGVRVHVGSSKSSSLRVPVGTRLVFTRSTP